MEFTKFDVMLIISMSLFLVIVSFVFPAVGFTGENVEESDIPDFNQSNQFDNPIEYPEYSYAPSQGTLNYVDDQVVGQDRRRIWLEGDSSDGEEITLTNAGPNVSQPDARVSFNHYSDGSPNGNDMVILNESNDFTIIENNSYEIAFEFIEFRNVGEENMVMTVTYDLIQSPDDVNPFIRLPIVGGLFSSFDQAAYFLSWVGSILWYLVAEVVTSIWNLGGISFDFASYFYDLGHWLITTYTSVITNAPTNYVRVFIGIPGLILSLEFMKLVIIAFEQRKLFG